MGGLNRVGCVAGNRRAHLTTKLSRIINVRHRSERKREESAKHSTKGGYKKYE
jgi:putative lipoic acid-binding regulatory protein